MADKIDNSPRGKISRGVKAAEAARKGRRPPTLAHLIGAGWIVPVMFVPSLNIEIYRGVGYVDETTKVNR